MTPLRILPAAAALLLFTAAAPAPKRQENLCRLPRRALHTRPRRQTGPLGDACRNRQVEDRAENALLQRRFHGRRGPSRHRRRGLSRGGHAVEPRPRLHRIPDSLGQGRGHRRILHRMGFHGPRERQTAEGHAARGREIRLRDRRQLVRRLALLRLDYPHAPRDRHPRSQDRALRPLLPVSGGPRAVGSDGSPSSTDAGLLPLRSGRQTRGIRLCRIEGPAARGHAASLPCCAAGPSGARSKTIVTSPCAGAPRSSRGRSWG